MAAFKLDIERGRVGVFRKKYWVFAFMRLEQRAKRKAGKRICAFLKKVLLSGTGCELPAKAFRGEGIKFPHLNGIIVSDMASVGSNCTIYHQVTLGIVSENKDRGAPFVGDNVTIGAGTKLLGPCVIGDDVRIGANAVVTKDVPAGATVVGANRIIATREDSSAAFC